MLAGMFASRVSPRKRKLFIGIAGRVARYHFSPAPVFHVALGTIPCRVSISRSSIENEKTDREFDSGKLIVC